jgi:alkylhydroperoxidase family enzyme
MTHSTRIEGVSEQRANPLVRVLYRLVRRDIAKLTGASGRVTDDIAVRAHRPRELVGYGVFEKSVAAKPSVAEHLRALAVLKSAVMQGCELCQDIGSHVARGVGVSDAQLLDLYRYRESEHFDETERLVLDLAVGMTRTPVQVSDELFAELRGRFDDAQLVELVNLIAVENLRSRFNGAFGLGSGGFAEGMVCARMEPATAAAATATDPLPADAPPAAAPVAG